MGDSLKKFKSLLKGAAGYAGIRLIDPLEVYYLPNENTFYPIISKSGCTSIKVMLIAKFKPDYQNSFPGIHHVNPSALTDGAIQRLYFRTIHSYTNWTKGKRMVFVMRDPFSRLYSCYLDVVSGKNTMYKFPSGLDWVYKYNTDLSFDGFLKKVCGTPDQFSDRHFRSQSFYLPDSVKSSLDSLEAFTLKEYMSRDSAKDASDESQALKLNTNKSIISDDMREQLLHNQEFNQRFKTDLELFEAISKKR